MNEHMSRYCTTFHCDARGDRYYCADCAKIYQCKNPCYNRPDRCGLVKEKEVKKSE